MAGLVLAGPRPIPAPKPVEPEPAAVVIVAKSEDASGRCSEDLGDSTRPSCRAKEPPMSATPNLRLSLGDSGAAMDG